MPQPAGTAWVAQDPKLRAVFDRFDLDCDGRLNEAEVSGFLESCGFLSDAAHTRQALMIFSE